MEREHLFTSLKRQILQTPAYQWVPLFPDKVERMCTLEDLAWWLGTIDCLAPSWGADSVALSHLSFLHFLLDFSYAGFMRLLFFITNVDTPGFFLGRTHNDDSSLQPVNHYEASRAIAHAVQGQLHLRKAVAQYLIFEYNLAGYETLTLAELAVQVERESTWECGDKEVASSTRNVASALTGATSEQECLRKMIALSLEIGTRHIRSRLAVNWLAHVRLRDPALQQALDRLKQMTLKAIWQQRLVYATDDTEFLRVIRRGDLEGDHLF